MSNTHIPIQSPVDIGKRKSNVNWAAKRIARKRRKQAAAQLQQVVRNEA
jgi:hypothetical protein